jgi:hypothetical protein
LERWPAAETRIAAARPRGYYRAVAAASPHDRHFATALWTVLAMAAWSLMLAPGVARAQELSPRAYWPAPVGTRLLIAGYTRTTGDVVTDPTLPLAGVESAIDNFVIGAQQTFDLLGRSANARFEVLYSDGTTKGRVLGQEARRDVSGVGDSAITLSVNLLGAPAMNRDEFRQMVLDPHPLLGASLRIVVPTGEYDSDRLINIGTNRWAARLQLGYIQPLRPKWLLEAAAGAWFFADNDDFLGQRREQDPIAAIEAHLIHLLRSGTWVALDGNYYRGGRSYLDGEPGNDIQRNSRVGFTLAWPIRRRHLIKAGVSRGIETASGGDFTIVLLNYALAFDGSSRR